MTNTTSKPTLRSEVLRMLTEYNSEQTPAHNASLILEHGGCDTGAMGELVYNVDCNTFYAAHKCEIDGELECMIDDDLFECGAEVLMEALGGIYTRIVWAVVDNIMWTIANSDEVAS